MLGLLLPASIKDLAFNQSVRQFLVAEAAPHNMRIKQCLTL